MMRFWRRARIIGHAVQVWLSVALLCVLLWLSLFQRAPLARLLASAQGDSDQLHDILYAVQHKTGGVDQGDLPDIMAESRAFTRGLLDKGRPGKPETMGLIPAVRAIAVNVGAATADSTNLTDKMSSEVLAFTRHGTKTLDAATDELKSMKTVTDAAKPAVQALTTTATNVGALAGTVNDELKSKAVASTVTSIRQVAANMVGISSNLQAISGDVHHWEQPIMNPMPCAKTKHPRRCKWGRGFKLVGSGTVLAGRAGQAALPIVLH